MNATFFRHHVSLELTLTQLKETICAAPLSCMEIMKSYGKKVNAFRDQQYFAHINEVLEDNGFEHIKDYDGFQKVQKELRRKGMIIYLHEFVQPDNCQEDPNHFNFWTYVEIIKRKDITQTEKDAVFHFNTELCVPIAKSNTPVEPSAEPTTPVESNEQAREEGENGQFTEG